MIIRCKRFLGEILIRIKGKETERVGRDRLLVRQREKEGQLGRYLPRSTLCILRNAMAKLMGSSPANGAWLPCERA